MLTDVTYSFKSLMLSGSGIIKSKLVFDDFEFTDDDIYNIDFKTGSSDGKTIAPGTVYVPELICEITPTEEWLRNKQMSWYVGLSENGEAYEWAKVCTAWVKTIEKSTDKVKITAYSKMYGVDKTYYSELTYPSTTIAVLNEIAGKINMPIDTDGFTAYTISEQPVGYTYRQVIADIAGLYGCFVLPNRDDTKLMFKWYEDSGLTIEDDYDEPQLEEMDVSVGNYAVNASGTWITHFTSGYIMEWSCKYMTRAILDDLADVLNITYRVGSFNLLSGNILIDPWDIVTLVYNGTEYKMPAGILEHKYDGGLTTALQTPGDTDGSTTSSSVSTSAQTTDRLTAQIIQTQSMLADKADIVELTAIKADINKLNVNKADIDQLEAVIAEVNSLDVKYASIDLSNIENGTIKQAMIAAGAIGTAQIADSSITDAKIVELTANKITTGTLSVERLIIRGSENSIIYAINNITGALQAENVDTINGEVLTERTVTADKIVANAITANEIASKTITANNILSGTITSSEIAAGAINTINIAAGAITADKISVDSLQAISARIGGFDIGDTYLSAGTDQLGSYEVQANTQIIDTISTGSGSSFNEIINMPYCADVSKYPIVVYYSIDGSDKVAKEIKYTDTSIEIYNMSTGGCTATYSTENETLTLSGGGFHYEVDFEVVWYKDIGGSVYLGIDGISCGSTFIVNDDGDLTATSGTIGGFNITDDTLSTAVPVIDRTYYCYINRESVIDGSNTSLISDYSIFLAAKAPYEYGADASEDTPALYITHGGDLVSTDNTYSEELRISGASMSMPTDHYISSNGKKIYGMNAAGRVKVNYDASCGTDISAASGYSINFYVGGSLKGWVNSSGITSSSDARLKSNIEDMDKRYVQIADKLKPKTYKYDDDLSKTSMGFIAQDLQTVIEELGIDSESFAPLSNSDDGCLGINYIQLIPILWAKVQQQDNTIEKLSEEIEKLKGETNVNKL